MVKIESEVPFGHSIYAWLYVHDKDLAELAPHGETERTYLAWETVRKELNPYFELGTGFEGYLVGRCPQPEAALDEVLDIGQHVLDSIALIYRYEYGFRSRLMKTLTREIADESAIRIWSACLGAELAKLRARMLHDVHAQLFQARTYRLVNLLPPMHYTAKNYDVRQTYSIFTDGVGTMPRLYINGDSLKPSQQDAWLVVENIGEFGHPLVRKYLDAALYV
ncbi:MAG: hypothetical protein BroJett018_27160 [Chloroflexota bacterium]|nr:MAG: hypothetical protein BroJett018_27160 [Chloroflexota bacterium]